VVEHVLDPGEVGVARRWDPVLPSRVVAKALATPLGDVERRVGEDEVSPQVRVEVIAERVPPLGPEVGVDAA